MEFVEPTPENILRAAEALRAGKVVAYPTETVYGLGVDPMNPSALEGLFRVKRRDPSNPVLLIVSSTAQLTPLIGEMSDRSRAYVTAFWPGPLSLLFPAKADVPPALLGPRGEICVRWTSSSVARQLCDAFGGAIVSTSANLSGQAPATRADEVPREGVEICLDGGTLAPGPVSTILDPETGRILREGAIGRAEIEAIARSCA